MFNKCVHMIGPISSSPDRRRVGGGRALCCGGDRRTAGRALQAVGAAPGGHGEEGAWPGGGSLPGPVQQEGGRSADLGEGQDGRG